MKKNLLFTTLLLLSIVVFGQKLPFQGKLIESGSPVEGTRTFEFEITTVGWSETHADVPVTDGLYFVVLGSINPLPDSLFYGETEQSMAITVEGTPLSPVILFKPLSSPFEGSELVVKNNEGTVVGSLKARTDSVKHGEFRIQGENTGLLQAGFFQSNDDIGSDTPFLSLSKDSIIHTYMSVLSWNNDTRGRIYLGSGSGTDYANIYPNLYSGRHNGRTLFQVGHGDWNGAENFGLLQLMGPNSGNFELTGQHWGNPDLPFFKMRGSADQAVVILSTETDSLESGSIRLNKKNGDFAYMNAEHINLWKPDGNNYIGHNQIDIASHADGKKIVLNPGRLEVIDTRDENNWKGLLDLSSQNWGSQDYSGLITVRGPSTDNIQLTGKNWENPELPWLKLSGVNNYDAIQLSIDNDSLETAYINLNSLNGKSSGLRAGGVEYRGPGSRNIDMGSKNWENEDYGYINMWGSNDFHAMEISVSADGNGDQFGYINLQAENGKNLYLSPDGFGVEGVGMNTQNNGSENFGYLFTRGPNTTNFETGGDWNSPDRAYLNMNGATDENRIHMGIHEDNQQVEFGSINVNNSDQKEALMEPSLIRLNRSGNNWREFASISLQDNYGIGEAGYFNLNGPNSANIWMGTRDWENSDLPQINIHGENDFYAMEISVLPDGNGDQYGFINLKSENGRNLELRPDNIENDRFKLYAAPDDPDRTGILWMYGPNSRNITLGGRYWQGTPDLPFLHLVGENNYEGIDLGMSKDGNGLQYGWINIKSENGQNVYLSPEGSVINGTLEVYGDITGSGNFGYSDSRLKKNIKQLDHNPLSKINHIKGVTYNWRQDEFPEKNFSTDKQIGLIAQELETQFPELVKTNTDGYKSVNYNGFTAVLLEAVKELNAKIVKLENENSQLKAELSASAASSAEIEALKAQMQSVIKAIKEAAVIPADEALTSTNGLK